MMHRFGWPLLRFLLRFRRARPFPPCFLGCFESLRSHDGQPQTIRLEFTRDVARYVQESRWHRSQKLTVQKDGSLQAEFLLTDTQEIKRWIMSFGPNARVLEPQDLVKELQRDLQQMVGNYGMEQQSQRGQS
jgi:predicted DNA-binding transcriptional regulator YafY